MRVGSRLRLIHRANNQCVRGLAHALGFHAAHVAVPLLTETELNQESHRRVVFESSFRIGCEYSSNRPSTQTDKSVGSELMNERNQAQKPLRRSTQLCYSKMVTDARLCRC